MATAEAKADEADETRAEAEAEAPQFEVVRGRWLNLYVSLSLSLLVVLLRWHPTHLCLYLSLPPCLSLYPSPSPAQQCLFDVLLHMLHARDLSCRSAPLCVSL